MTRPTLAVPRARFNWRSLAPLALAALVSATVVVAGVASHASTGPTRPTPVTEQELYGKWDGVLQVDGKPYCLAEWPCHDALVVPSFAG